MNENLNELSDWIRLCDQRAATIAAQTERIAEMDFCFRHAIGQRDKSDAERVAQAAEIERLAAENEALKRALEQAESIRDGLVSDADSIGELIFGDYVPDANGNDRFSADGYTAQATDDYDVPAYTEMSIETARKVASLINEMMDVDWIDTEGERS